MTTCLIGWACGQLVAGPLSDAAARFFALLLLVTGVTPVVAPLAGGQILRFADWRGSSLRSPV